MPSTAMWLKQANDFCLYGSMPLFGAVVLHCAKHSYVRVWDHMIDGTPVAIFLVAATSLALLRIVCRFKGQHAHHSHAGSRE